MTDPIWERVCDQGTDPQLLARLVARSLMPDSSISVMQRRARERSRAEDTPGQLLDGLAGRPGPPALEVAADVAVAWQQRGVRAACAGDPAYPPRLAVGWPTTGGPLWLATRGHSGLTAGRPSVAIVGNRRATGYGRGVAAWLAEAAAEAGAVVVSGGAVGIDAVAHRAALQAGSTVVVLGCGHAVDYPAGHAAPGGLFDAVLEAGGALVGELLPDADPRPHNVRSRNRIVAGLADAVVVVEGGQRSGSLITASEAAERGVAVLAVPGDVRAPRSAAPHQLLAEGAAPCRSPDDLLAALDVGHRPSPDIRNPDGRGRDAASTLPPAVHTELARRWPRPVQADELAGAVGIPAGRLLAALTRARIAGEVAEGPEGVRLTREPADARTRGDA